LARRMGTPAFVLPPEIIDPPVREASEN